MRVFICNPGKVLKGFTKVHPVLSLEPVWSWWRTEISGRSCGTDADWRSSLWYGQWLRSGVSGPKCAWKNTSLVRKTWNPILLSPISDEFKKGHPKYGGRKKGVPNKFAADIKGWLIAAAEELGSDGQGKGGGRGFVKSVGLTKAEALLAALVKQLPPAKEDVTANANSGGTVEFRIFALPHGCQIDENGVIWHPDGAPATAAETEFHPYEPTRRSHVDRPVCWAGVVRLIAEQPGVEVKVEPPSVTRLDRWRAKRDEPPPGVA